MGRDPCLDGLWKDQHPVMEQHDPTRRQYVPSTYSAQQSQQSGSQLPSQYASPTPNERFRQTTHLQQPLTNTSPTGRPGSSTQHMYNFSQTPQYRAVSAMQPSTMQYSSEVQAQDAQRQQQQQQYTSYGTNIMYNMAPPPMQQPDQSVPSQYEHLSQYRQRPSAAPETLAQFGVPQSAQYYLAAGQQGPTSAPAPELSAHQISSQYQHSSYPQPGPSASQAYPGTMIDSSHSGAYTYAQHPQYSAQNPQAQVQSQGADPGFNDYQAKIHSIFTLVQDGMLSDTAAPLIHASQYLLGNAENLGLTRDDDTLHDDRIRLWDEFNRAWLTTLQRQFDVTEDVIRNGQPLRESYSILTSQTLEQLSRELVRLCDGVERHGLVDYQMGVAEETIMDLLLRCLSLLDPRSGRSRDAAPKDDSSSAAMSARH